MSIDIELSVGIESEMASSVYLYLDICSSVILFHAITGSLGILLGTRVVCFMVSFATNGK